MIVYADILVIVNLIVDYFLLLAAAKLLRQNPKTYRLLLGGLLGGFSSLVIFLPKLHILLELPLRLALCFLITFSVFGYRSRFAYIKSLGTVTLVTCGYGGVMTAIWTLFRPRGMRVIRSVVYFDISPMALVIASGGFYLLFSALSYIFRRKAVTASFCTVTLSAGNRQITVKGLLDTGNSLDDIIGGGEVLIGDTSSVTALFGEGRSKDETLRHRYRVIPCSTVSGGGILEAYRCDKATVICENRSVTLQNPLLAESKVSLGEETSVIVNPEIFTV